jgi:trimeric autotransporter adhesin
MTKRYSLLAGAAVLLLYTSQLLAQPSASIPGNFARPWSRGLNDRGVLALPPQHTGLQAYAPPRHWQGLDLGLFFGTQNTATGTQALNGCTSCYQNVADGYTALYSCTSCWGNTAVGFEALNFAVSTSENTAVGWAALDVTTGSYNTALGSAAMENNSTGTLNTGVGYSALGVLTGSYNTAVGASSFALGQAESYSTAVGYSAMQQSHSSTGYNTAIGANALFGSDPSGAGPGNTGSFNVAAGADAMTNNTTGSGNEGTGYYAMYYNSSGSYNQASGSFALYTNTTGSENAGSGAGALEDNTTGNFNIGMGYLALYENTTGSYNTALGSYANTGSGALTNATALGANATVSSSNHVVVGASSVTSIGGYANWTNFSDGRYKKNIQPNVPGLAFINKLNPVTYTLDIAGIEAKLHQSQPSLPANATGVGGGLSNPSEDPVMKQAMQDKSAVTYTGFVAQDVEKAADSVGFTFSGIDKPKNIDQSFYGLRYGDFVPPLVKAVQELSASSDKKDSAINALQGRFDSLQTQVNELRALLLAKNSSTMSGASLDQNTPNPFTGSTIIGYSLPKGVTTAQMQITDVTGKVLALIPLSGGGKNTLTASTSGFASGTYTYSLIVNGQLVSTRQMISIR